MTPFKITSLVCRCFAIVLLTIAILLFFVKINATYETEKWLVTTSGTNVLDSSTFTSGRNYFEQIDELKEYGFGVTNEIFLLVSFGISIAVIIASFFVKFLRKIFFAAFPLIATVFCIILIFDISDGYVIRHDLIGMYNGYRLYEHQTVQFGISYIAPLILSALSFISLCASGTVEFVSKRKEKTSNANNIEFIEYDKQIYNSKNTSNIKNTQETETDISINNITKYKKLLDQGIITQEEFDAKKKQLLDL